MEVTQRKPNACFRFVREHKLLTIGVCWLALLLLIAGGTIFHAVQARRYLYWDGGAYVYSGATAEELPEDAELLGPVVYRRYKQSLGENLSCNLEDVSPSLVSMSGSENRGNVYYDADTEQFYVAVHTAPNEYGAAYYVFR